MASRAATLGVLLLLPSYSNAPAGGAPTPPPPPPPLAPLAEAVAVLVVFERFLPPPPPPLSPLEAVEVEVEWEGEVAVAAVVVVVVVAPGWCSSSGCGGTEGEGVGSTTAPLVVPARMVSPPLPILA